MLTATLGQPVTEVSHSVDVRIKDGVAVYKVQRVFANAGERADEAGLEIGRASCRERVYHPV